MPVKICTVCKRTYENDALSYCLEDGGVLISVGETASGNKIVSERDLMSNPTESFDTLSRKAVAAAPGKTIAAPVPRKSLAWVWILLTVFGLITMCSISAAIYAFMSRSNGGSDNRAANTSQNPGNLFNSNIKTNVAVNVQTNSNDNANNQTNGNIVNNSQNGNANIINLTNVNPVKETAKDLTIEKYNQIKSGMSYRELTAILGAGREQSKSSGGGYTVVSYEWTDSNNKSITVRIENDKLNSKSQTNLNSRIDPSLTLAKFDQIKEGMSYKEVAQVLGSEGTEGSTYYNTIKTVRYDWYPSKYSYINVSFENEKMVRKSQFGLK